MTRVGTKRSDRRWRDPDGTIWASEFEFIVFDALTRAGRNLRKCGPSDTVDYTEQKRSNLCLECGSNKIVQVRTYTPDLCFVRKGRRHSHGRAYFIETKGYFRRQGRSLFRHFVKSNPSYPIRVIFERDGWVTKGRTKYSDYFDRYLKTVPYHVWNGDIPDDWK